MIRILFFAIILLISNNTYCQNTENLILHIKKATLAISQKDTSLWNSLTLSKNYVDSLFYNKNRKIVYDNEFLVLKHRIDKVCTSNNDTSICYDVFEDFDSLISLAHIDRSEFENFEIGNIQTSSNSNKQIINIDEYSGSFVLINNITKRRYLITYDNLFQIFDSFFELRIIGIEER